MIFRLVKTIETNSGCRMIMIQKLFQHSVSVASCKMMGVGVNCAWMGLMCGVNASLSSALKSSLVAMVGVTSSSSSSSYSTPSSSSPPTSSTFLILARLSRTIN